MKRIKWVLMVLPILITLIVGGLWISYANSQKDFSVNGVITDKDTGISGRGFLTTSIRTYYNLTVAYQKDGEPTIYTINIPVSAETYNTISVGDEYPTVIHNVAGLISIPIKGRGITVSTSILSIGDTLPWAFTIVGIGFLVFMCLVPQKESG